MHGVKMDNNSLEKNNLNDNKGIKEINVKEKGFFKKKSYKFTNKKQSVRGIISSVFLVMSLGMIVYAIVLSFKEKGNAGVEVGALGMEALLVSIVGVVMGVYGFKEEDVFLKFPWIGTVGNTIVCLFLLGTILVGI